MVRRGALHSKNTDQTSLGERHLQDQRSTKSFQSTEQTHLPASGMPSLRMTKAANEIEGSQRNPVWV